MLGRSYRLDDEAEALTELSTELRCLTKDQYTGKRLNMFADFRHAIRSLIRQPGFTAIAVLTLGLGIGATAAIFTLLERVVLNPLPYPESRQLAWVESGVPGMGEGAVWGVSVAGFFEFQQQLKTVSAMGAYTPTSMGVAEEAGAATQARAAFVTADLLPLLGASRSLGRLFDNQDTQTGAEDVVILNHGYWATRFGSDSTVIGRSITLEGRPVQVIGVMASGVDLPRRSIDLWLPLRINSADPPVNAHWLNVIARLRPGSTMEELAADLKRVTATFPTRFPQAYNPEFMQASRFTTVTMPLKDQVIGSNGRTLWLLLGAVGLVLCIAAANVAALLLVRAESRRTELKLRAALGASRGRIARHLMVEGVAISVLASVTGVMLAVAGIGGLRAIAPESLPRLSEVAVGPATLAVSLLLALIAGIGASLLPVLHFSGASPLGAMSGIAIGRVHGQHRPITRNVLVVGQLALAVMLVTASCLMLRSFQRLRAVDPGFDATGVLTVELSLPNARYQNYTAVAEFYRALESRVKALPGVQAAGVTSDLPLEGFGGCASMFVEDRPLDPGANPPCLGNLVAGPGMFAAMGIPLVGREPGWHDLDAGSGAVVVTRSLAERFWPGENPIGKGIRGNGNQPPYYRVVGVTGALRARGLDKDPAEAVFFPLKPIEGAQLWSPLSNSFLVVRTSSDDPTEVASAVRGVIAELDPMVATASIQTMEQIVRSSSSVARVTFTMILLGIASSLALILSVVSIYGVISYVAGQRRSELGLRMVLGATRPQATGLVVRQALGLVTLGLGLGLLGAIMLGRTLRSLLFEVSPTDPLSLLAVSSLLLLVGGVAAWLPANRATAVDPMVALRSTL
jgi:predicted permease